MNWRFYIVIILLCLSAIDLLLTYYYVSKYKEWQPNKPYELIELNPLLRFLWNNFGLHLGMFIGSVIILGVVYLVGKSAHPLIVFALLFILILTMFNHHKNIVLLHKLIEQYPSGYLPVGTFGNVVGNNPIK